MEELPRPAAFLPDDPPKLIGRSSSSGGINNASSTVKSVAAVVISSSLTRHSEGSPSSSNKRILVEQQAVIADQQGNLEEVKALVESGAVSVGWKDHQAGGCTLLHWASINGRMEVVEYLLSNQAPINAIGGALQETSLQWAARQVCR